MLLGVGVQRPEAKIRCKYTKLLNKQSQNENKMYLCPKEKPSK
jgi:hypothetical protein